MILVNPNGLIGDAVTGHNVILDLATSEQQAGRKLYLIYRNKLTKPLLPYHENIIQPKDMHDIWHMPDKQEWRALDVASNFHKYHHMHMIQAYYAQMGLQVKPLEGPKITFEKVDVPGYDYIIAPFSRSDHKNNKVWPLELWHQVIDIFHEQGHSVAMVGGPHDSYRYPGIAMYMNEPLNVTLSLIVNARKAVVTMDNGISHLCHGLEIDNHALLYPIILSETWVRNPKAKSLRAGPASVTVDQMLNLIKSAEKS